MIICFIIGIGLQEEQHPILSVNKPCNLVSSFPVDNWRYRDNLSHRVLACNLKLAACNQFKFGLETRYVVCFGNIWCNFNTSNYIQIFEHILHLFSLKAEK